MDVSENARGNRENAVEDRLDSEDSGDSFSESLDGDEIWYYMPDPVLLNIFQYLTPRELTTAGRVCRTWNRVSHDEFLWKDLFYQTYKIDPDVGIMPRKCSWLGEFKRLTDHVPLLETEVLTDHYHQVLHVSFSHNGEMFATCSKDGYIYVWDSQYPVKLKYLHDMKTFSWQSTQFSQFNSSDTLLLVSGVHLDTSYNASGEIAVFRLAPGFDLLCRVLNKPYDIFGTWYSEHYLLSGNLCPLTNLDSTSDLWLNKANQEPASIHVPIVTQLFRISKFYRIHHSYVRSFSNGNASSIRTIMIANCLSPAQAESEEQQSKPSSSNVKEEKGNPPSHKDLLPTTSNSDPQEQEEPVVLRHASSRLQYSTLEGGFMNWRKLGDGFDYVSPIQYNQEYRQVEMEQTAHDSDKESESPQWEDENESGESSATKEGDPEKYLIFTTGSKTYAPHQVGFKRIKNFTFPTRLDPGPSLRGRLAQRERERRIHANWFDYESVADKFDKADHLIDLHGHIIGMGLSPDHRYLYVNTRPWPTGYVITNPMEPPPIAQEIDIHMIDLATLKQVGTMLRAHKAYTPNNECSFIFLDVCNEYVASGAEDKHGYLWDRHYGVCLAKFPHSDVVNSVAINPRNSEMLVTTSDDYTVKVWRSRAMVRSLGLNEESYDRGMEVLKRRQFQKTRGNID